MKVLFSLIILTSNSSVFAATTSTTPLSEALAGSGQLVFLKAVTIPGTFTDGSPYYVRSMSYAATGADKLNCSAMYTTATHDSSSTQTVGGIDAVFPESSSIAWLSGDANLYDDVRFQISAVSDGSVSQSMSLSFDSLTSKIISMDCDIVTPPGTVLTVGDFEAATGGLMSLRSN